jgi:hypothetical protein
MSEVLVVETGVLTQASRKRILASDIILIEVTDASKVSFMRANEMMSSDDMTWAALKALAISDGYNEGTKQRTAFVKNLEKVAQHAFERRYPAPSSSAPTPETGG